VITRTSVVHHLTTSPPHHLTTSPPRHLTILHTTPTGVFTSLLVFNLVFARLILKEPLTPPRVRGALVICVGVVCCVAAAPTGVPTEFSPEDVMYKVRMRPTYAHLAHLCPPMRINALTEPACDQRLRISRQ
jgi:hypothetical protein